ncbi:J domain-containing protein [Vibrio kyushuensis]|uniref:J domain-containing protein n=1 Tax=Vibrio kyushuensis TaxID=2910249 RepID=UPI003D0B2593
MHILKSLFSTLLLLPVLLLPITCFSNTISDLTPLAEQNNVSAQFDLANTYANSSAEEDLNQAFYWYQQAANQNHIQSQFSLATHYLKGIGTEPDLNQALYWLTKLAVEGNIDAQIALATIYEKHPEKPKNLDMAELWYLVAQPNSEKAESGYSRVLEAKFNQRKAQQVSSLDQLDVAFEMSDVTVESTSTSPKPSDQTYSNPLIVIGIIIIAVLISITVKRRKRKKLSTDLNQKQILKETTQNQALIIKQQKRQLETMFHQVKKLQQSNQRAPDADKLTIACAIFGFKATKLPDQKQIKVRYKQLSKLYHPDLSGSDEEMKRLNSALKIIITHTKKPTNVN